MSPSPDNKDLPRKKTSIGPVVLLIAIVTGGSLYAITEYQHQAKRAAYRRFAAEAKRHEITPENPPSPATFFPIDVVPRPPLVKGAKIVSREAANEAIRDDEMVLAVEINGKARAYPINMLNGPSREIINDTLGGEAIAATW